MDLGQRLALEHSKTPVILPVVHGKSGVQLLASIAFALSHELPNPLRHADLDLLVRTT